ncbi:hypothetical protein BDZ94DRAFT_1296127 [Collybia nuda]|uniref:Acetyl-CoA synthetase-like protein n=1 Tax=Collybia nuda TaxID=64659 RepID=A0A9P5YE04_9AGAR|nr:hypothetical protein BDZ94DRAFT_1296127 [Collybia nuda]
MAFLTPQATGCRTFSPPPLDGSLSLPEIYDYNGIHNSQHPLFVYEGLDGRMETILWGQASRAVHTAARYVQSSLRAENTHNQSTVISILGNMDTFTYCALIVGILRAGYQAFPISTRNSAVAIAHLLRQVNSKYVFVSNGAAIQRLVSTVCAQPLVGGVPGVNLHLLPIPSFVSLFEMSGDMFVPLAPMEHPPDLAPALILHSSGTSAFPKPVRFTHRTLIQWGLLPYYGDIDICGQILCSHSLPLYHAMGTPLLTWTMTSGVIVASFAPDNTPVIPTPERVLSGALATKSSIIFCVPAFIEAWVVRPENISKLRKFLAVVFGGAPMQSGVGERLVAEGVNLIPFYGATEVGCVVKFLPRERAADWSYFEFSSHCEPAFIQYQGNVFQLLIVDCPTLTPNIINTRYNSMDAYDTNDLLVQHPTIPQLWRVYGRCDDQLAHSTGEKTNPVPIESTLIRHPKIRGAVMFGRGHFHAGILLDLLPEYAFDPIDKQQLSAFRAEILPLVEEANRFAPTHSRLFQEMILVSKPSKLFEYNSKGKPMRKVVLELYEHEIERVYASIEVSSQADIPVPMTWRQAECTVFVRKAVIKAMKYTIKDDDDLFQAGCDSFRAIWIRNIIVDGLCRNIRSHTRNKIPQNLVYLNPTINKLTSYLIQVIHHGQTSVAMSITSGKFAEMEGLVRKYCATFPSHRPQAYKNAGVGGDAVLLTGSTGFLGSHILKSLVETPEVTRVYTLNRRDTRGKRSIRDRHLSGFSNRGLDVSILSSDKLFFLEGDTTSEYLGLGPDMYCQLQTVVTHIIHNAWRVDFNVSLSSMEPLIAGTRRIVDFALGSKREVIPRLVFISTLSVFLNWARGIPAPENENRQPGTAMGLGYTESKWVTENILIKASEKSPLKPIIIRPGHICGGPSGYWDPVEWVPAIVRSGQHLGCLPRPEGNVTWIPAHVAAAAITEMRSSQDTFLNLTHPHPVSSSFIFETFAEHLDIRLIGYRDWLTALETSSIDNNDVVEASQHDNPALLLLDFYRSLYRPSSTVYMDTEAFGFPTPSIDQALAAAPKTLTNLPPLSHSDIQAWVVYWRKMGALR